MHSNLLASSLFVAAFMAVFVVALPGSGTGSIKSSCEKGSLQCCDSVQSADSKAIKDALKHLDLKNMPVIPATATVGLSCTPITALATAGNSCSSQPVCCTGTNYNGALIVGCTAVNSS